MHAYVMAQIDIHDPEEYRHYLDKFMPIFERHGGRLLVTSSKEPVVIEGEWALPRIVLMQFPDMACARAWLDDPDYVALARHRHAAARANLVLVEGVG